MTTIRSRTSLGSRGPLAAAFAAVLFSLLFTIPLYTCSAPVTPGEPDAGSLFAVRVGTWNMCQFGSDGGSGTRHASLISSLAADLLTVQEIRTEPAFAELVAQLDGYSSTLGPLVTTSGNLRQGFLWRTARLSVHDVVPLFEDQSTLFPRPPLQAIVDVLDDSGATRETFIVIAVHLKAGKRASDEDSRVKALSLLEGRLRTIVEEHVDDQMLLLGDFNEAPTDARATEAYAPFTSAPDRYRLLTSGFADAGIVTYLPYSLVFDHVVATAALDGARDGGLPMAVRLDQQNSAYREEVSDHLPVVLDLRF